jgi:SOS-response transcriptional repressor LexA
MNKNKAPTKDADSLQNLSDRLAHALNILKISQAALARQINVKPQAIHYLCNSRSKKSGFTYEIAEALQINSLWLACGEGAMQPEKDPDEKLITSQTRIPLLNRRQIKHRIIESRKPDESPENIGEWVFTNSDVGKHGFAFQLTDKSMFPRFDQDTFAIINPDKIPKNKDFIVAYLNESDDIICRQYEDEHNPPLLNPANITMYKKIIMSEKDIILGVMVEARWKS